MASWARIRLLWRWAVVLCGVAALLTIQLNALFAEYKKVSSLMALQSPLLSIQELDQVEYLTLLPPLGLKHPQTINLNHEFLNQSSPARSLFFPSSWYGTLDPTNTNTNATTRFFLPEKIWLDTAGNPIQAHGGGILFDHKSATYFWYGEYKNGNTNLAESTGTARVDVIGVACYSSKDLWAWKFEGIVLASHPSATHDLHKSNVLERPKVIYNEKTNKFVMWMHVDDATYSKAAVGVAISDHPTGPFTYVRGTRPNGFDSRDMTVFKDEDDGAAYLIYASARNKEMHISRLSDDYMEVENVTVRALIGMHREAPAVFKHGGVYYMVTSGCSGWLPNEALVHEAESMLGTWETIGNPCVGANKEYRAATFFSQGSFVLPMPGGGGGDRGLFIFMADRWNPANLRDSRYMWLPLTVKAKFERYGQFPLWSKVAIFWHERWRAPIKDNGETYYVSKPFMAGDDL
ncbi:hypothetical protein SASPL_126060 [Salvia splendens]|uniref:Uncharacterized protein n=1 Tax=Salvia splendens TaxID=180675 RepID=A0A8X8ZQS3_SALSN|nr:uncharacterized protein LOC121747981 [Salvia splendens]KAG6413351.1 hypothetical protein SASPL_126060 [Salvia splendens]